MKELNTFRQFINESKENVDELFGRKKDPIKNKHQWCLVLLNLWMI